jgi:hypothetical protein
MLTTDNLPPTTVCLLLVSEKEEPLRTKLRTDNEDPSASMFMAEHLPPSLVNPLTDIEEASAVHPTTLKVFTCGRLDTPLTERLEPSLPAFRRLKVLPMWQNLNVLSRDPNLAVLRTEKLLDSLTLFSTLNSAPNLAAPKAETPLPTLATVRTDIVEPIDTGNNTDMRDPVLANPRREMEDAMSVWNWIEQLPPTLMFVEEDKLDPNLTVFLIEIADPMLKKFMIEVLLPNLHGDRTEMELDKEAYPVTESLDTEPK